MKQQTVCHDCGIVQSMYWLAGASKTQNIQHGQGDYYHNSGVTVFPRNLNLKLTHSLKL